jgi:hypothetical protein
MQVTKPDHINYLDTFSFRSYAFQFMTNDTEKMCIFYV